MHVAPSSSLHILTFRTRLYLIARALHSLLSPVITQTCQISPHILSAEKFGLHINMFLISRCADITPLCLPRRRKEVGRGADYTFGFWYLFQVDAFAGKDELVGRVTVGVSDLMGTHFLSFPPHTDCLIPGTPSTVLSSAFSRTSTATNAPYSSRCPTTSSSPST